MAANDRVLLGRILEAVASMKTAVSCLPDIKQRVTRLETKVDGLCAARHRGFNHKWDVVKLSLAAVIGALVSLFVNHKS